MLSVLFATTVAACSSTATQQNDYNGFLQRIAADCKPLVIGSDNIGQAITFNGLGAKPENYNNFLSQTSALYNGSIPATAYRNSLNSFLGGGSANERSFDCIEAHLPKS